MADDDPQQVTGVVEGEVLVDKYRVERVLGVGGMGVVVAARHLQLDSDVAMKILLPSMLGNPEAVARFAREARAAIEIRSEHVARIFDVGTLPTGAPYIVMELLEGADLRRLLDEHGPFAVEDAVDFVVQACEAIAEAHGLGIVHRDLKPGNLFCVQRTDGRRAIKVLDFGISKVTGPLWSPPLEPLTVAAAVMGTPSYMSPEQLEAPHTVDSRTDVWALGVVLYELLTGKAPFEGSTLPQVSVRIAVRPPLPVRELRPNIPLGVVVAIDRCLEKDRDQRYQRVVDLATALLPFGSRRARISVNRIIEHTDVEDLRPRLPLPHSLPLRLARSSRHTVRRAIPALLVLAVMVVMGGVWSAHARHPRADGVARVALRDEAQDRVAVAAKAMHVEPFPILLPVVVQRSPVKAARELTTREDRAVRGGPRTRDEGGRRSARGSRTPSKGAASLTATPSSAADASRSAASSCDPPFELDDQGRKHFKPECWSRAPRALRANRVVGDANCDPSYELDDEGRKHFKPECFANSSR